MLKFWYKIVKQFDLLTFYTKNILFAIVNLYVQYVNINGKDCINTITR